MVFMCENQCFMCVVLAPKVKCIFSKLSWNLIRNSEEAENRVETIDNLRTAIIRAIDVQPWQGTLKCAASEEILLFLRRESIRLMDLSACMFASQVTGMKWSFAVEVDEILSYIPRK